MAIEKLEIAPVETYVFLEVIPAHVSYLWSNYSSCEVLALTHGLGLDGTDRCLLYLGVTLIDAVQRSAGELRGS